MQQMGAHSIANVRNIDTATIPLTPNATLLCSSKGGILRPPIFVSHNERALLGCVIKFTQLDRLSEG